MAKLVPMSDSFDFQQAPGFLIRRLHQFTVAIFMEEAAAFDVTPVQLAILNALMAAPGSDQVTLANRVAFDAATSGSVIARLEGKGWVRRESDPNDKRRKLLWATPLGEKMAHDIQSAVARTQQRILGPLSQEQQQQLMTLLGQLVAEHGKRA